MLSSHRCMGVWQGHDLGAVDLRRDRALRTSSERQCDFRHVCLDTRGRWIYFTKATDWVRTDGFGAGVNLWARGGFGRRLPPLDQTFIIRRSPVPAKAAYLLSPLLVKVRPFAPSNLGHFLGNSLFPAFHLAWRFIGAAALDQPFKLLFDGLNQTDPQEMRRRCDRARNRRAAAQGARAHHAEALQGELDDASSCSRHVQLVSKFTNALVPALTGSFPLWEESMRREVQRTPGGLLCARRLLVGTGGLSWSSIFNLADGKQRRPPITLWPDFIEKLSRGLIHNSSHADTPGRAVVLIKHGRRAPVTSAYRVLAQLLYELSGVDVHSFDPATLSVRQQVELVASAPLGITPDGGTSFLCAFMPAGAGLVVLGDMEKWVWANDRRVRAMYCTPQGSRIACDSHAATADCYPAAAVAPCLRATLPKLVEHIQLTWPALVATNVSGR